MAGDVDALTEAISNALDVEHGEEGQRDAIARGIAEAIAEVWAPSCKVVTQTCNAGGSHPTGKLE